MQQENFRARTWRRTLAVGALLALAPAAAPAKDQPVAETLDVGAFRLTLVPARNWQAEVRKDAGFVVFHFLDRPSLTQRATIGLYRFVVPVATRTEERRTIGAAFVTHDVTGAQRSLLRGNPGLVPLGRNGRECRGGQILDFVEPVDARDGRLSSTTFVRAWLFFPKSFAENGALYLLLGRLEADTLLRRPDELDRVDEIIAAIRDP